MRGSLMTLTEYGGYQEKDFTMKESTTHCKRLFCRLMVRFGNRMKVSFQLSIS